MTGKLRALLFAALLFAGPFAVLLAAAGANPAAAANADYDQTWSEASAAVVTFAAASFDSAGTDAKAVHRETAERHGDALAQLSAKLPPPGYAAMHWRLLTLHDEIDSAMTMVVDSEERDDDAGAQAGWLAFGRAVRGLNHATVEPK